MDAHFYQSRCKKEKNRHPLLSVEILMEKIRTPINFFTRKSGCPFLLFLFCFLNSGEATTMLAQGVNKFLFVPRLNCKLIHAGKYRNEEVNSGQLLIGGAVGSRDGVAANRTSSDPILNHCSLTFSMHLV